MQNKMETETSLHAAAGWSRLPSDLLILILLRFLPLNDVIRCGAVCKEWRSAFSDAREKLRRRPWLMIRKKVIIRKRKGGTDTLLFRFRSEFLSHPLHDDGRVYKIDDSRVYKIDDGRVYKIDDGRVCEIHPYEFFMGSSQGWLIIGREQIQAPPKIYMVDVHTGDLYNLPPLRNNIMALYHIPKTVVVPSSSGRYAVACTITKKGGGLMLGQGGGDQWTILEKPPHMISLYLEDLNYHEGLLYSVCCLNGNVLVWDLSQISNSPKVLPGPVGKKVSPRKLYIVPESPYGLLFIARYPCKVEVFALDSKTGEWVQVRCMGKCSLFLGRNQSMCLSRSDFPDMEENGIYLNATIIPESMKGEDRYLNAIPKSMKGADWYLNGFYNLQDGSFLHHEEVTNMWSAWVIPNLK